MIYYDILNIYDYILHTYILLHIYIYKLNIHIYILCIHKYTYILCMFVYWMLLACIIFFSSCVCTHTENINSIIGCAYKSGSFRHVHLCRGGAPWSWASYLRLAFRVRFPSPIQCGGYGWGDIKKISEHCASPNLPLRKSDLVGLRW